MEGIHFVPLGFHHPNLHKGQLCEEVLQVIAYC